jgi:hypothetical protein
MPESRLPDAPDGGSSRRNHHRDIQQWSPAVRRIMDGTLIDFDLDLAHRLWLRA